MASDLKRVATLIKSKGEKDRREPYRIDKDGNEASAHTDIKMGHEDDTSSSPHLDGGTSIKQQKEKTWKQQPRLKRDKRKTAATDTKKVAVVAPSVASSARVAPLLRGKKEDGVAIGNGNIICLVV